MLTPEMVLVIGLLSVYTVLGPFVLLFIYIYLDRFAENKKKNHIITPDSKDPALWTSEDVMHYLKHRNS
jgi:hypothetical protein